MTMWRSFQKDHQRDDAGVGLVDVILATALFLGALIAIAAVIQNSDTAYAVAKGQGGAVVVANNVLADSTAYNCGTETGVAGPAQTPAYAAAQPGAPTVASIEATCSSMYGGASILGDPAPYTTSRQGYSYTVTYQSIWAVQGTAGSSTAANVCPTTYSAPVGQFRLLTVSWTTATVTHTFPQSAPNATFAGTPSDRLLYHNSADGGLVFTAMPAGSMITLKVPGWATIQRYSNPGGCVWFPFLPPGGGYVATYYPTGSGSGTALSALTVASQANVTVPA
jgi:hypothetical protein